MGNGRLTTHVLDTARGAPAAGLEIALYRIGADGVRDGEPVAQVTTNADGRTDGPLLEGTALTQGVYELVFQAGDYIRRNGVAVGDPAFLDVIPIRFGISDANQHFHVPLLLSPFGYSTYRGS